MESLIKIQIGTCKNIENARSNFKKSPKDRITQAYIETRLEALESQWQNFIKIHTELIGTYDDIQKSNYNQQNIYLVTENLYFDYKTELKEKLKLGQDELRSISPTVSKTNEQSQCLVKLPTITIPTFCGSYAEWSSFRDLFVSLVHTNQSLDNVQKLHYLKTHLSGEAEQLLRNVTITSDNYAVGWKLLEERFNNKRYIANAILKRFMSQKNVNSESSKALKELLDTSNECITALKNLDIKTDSWDIIVIYILCLKLDIESRKMWESKLCVSQDSLPTYKEFAAFLQERFRSLEFLEHKSFNNVIRSKVLYVTEGVKCQFCSEGHKLANCKKFVKEETNARRNFVQAQGLCFNCLGSNHLVYSCRVPSKCKICHRKHHSLLHVQLIKKATDSIPSQRSSVDIDSAAISASQQSVESSERITTCHTIAQGQVLLATAMVGVASKSGRCITLRSLLDPGSQASFMTESAVQLLGLQKKACKSYISGLGSDRNSEVTSKYMVNINMQSLVNSKFAIQIKAHVLKKITTLLPDKEIIVQKWSKVPDIKLADPNYNIPNKVDILLGADVYSQIIEEGLIRNGPDMPVAQKTKLGWILFGNVQSGSQSKNTFHNSVICMHAVEDNHLLQKFWELENEPKFEDDKRWTDEEKKCEEIFSSSTVRDSEGRYVVKLPFRDEDPQCQYGNTLAIATKRYESLEKRLMKSPESKDRYAKVIHEYLKLGHMKPVSVEERKAASVYLPHHAVVNESKTTTKIRVVFDGSSCGTNGISLNNDLMVGPKLQSDLRHLVMRWRLYPVCLTSDIVKMYRQIKVTERDTDFQRIVWRDDPKEELQHFKLLTVTFGTASAPYLAVRSLQQLARDEAVEFPTASEKVLNDYYMDDLLTGCETVEEGKKLYADINNLLKRGGFEIQKWASNSKVLMAAIDEKKTEALVDIKNDTVIKILGLTWNKDSDNFEYSVQLPPIDEPVTKRKVISDIAKLFDPLGWLAPAIIVAKIFIQKLWITGIGWDDELPENLYKEWVTYRQDLLKLQDISIPRWIDTSRTDVRRELHGFSDASNDAYSAVVYLRVIDENGGISVHLVTSKTRVAPIQQVCIPRLELCGAALLSKVLREVANVLGIDQDHIYAYTDSTVVLAWLSCHPGRWKTFIANRVSEILTTMNRSQWAHVRSQENPADAASRGIKPSEMVNLKLWFSGPMWLKEKKIKLDTKNIYVTNLEQKVCHIGVNVLGDLPEKENEILKRFSTLKKLVRVISYCKRFIKGNKAKKEIWLTSEELREALDTCIKEVQKEHFKDEIKSLEKRVVSKKSKLTSLNPFLDDAKILRVGGRLQRAELTEATKHPIILPDKSHFTTLVIGDAHEKTLHGGIQLTLNYLRSKYWIINGKNKVKLYIRRCVTCIRYSAKTSDQLMGQLPQARVRPCRPFIQTGIDYAGPINIRMSKGRGNKSYRGYICLFVCMATRAVHLEAVSDLTSSGFLAAFRRFVARRGYCSDVFSDNGTNFVGASKELQTLFSEERSSMARDIASCLASEGVTWHFNPPHTPHFGGLWEAGVRSTKHHLKRVVGNATLTFEELGTFLSQIEACLNSRPISKISVEASDPLPLTPGHFLIGEPLVLVPDSNYESNISSLKRWQLTQRMVQDFWCRWSQEYLTQFLNRYRWAYQKPEPNVGDVVLVKEDGLPPGKWLLGVILEKFPGIDKITRVVSLRCKGSIIKRPVHKLCILPVTK